VSTRPRRSLLLVCHVTPPTTMSAARRAGALTKHLARLGHSVAVLTSVAWGSGAIPGAALTVRTRDLLSSRLNWRRAGIAALKGDSGGGAPMAPSILARWVVPDLEMLGWTPFALLAARRLAAERRIDCVITSSPPASAHLVGVALQLRGVPWVADLRDGWRFESLRPRAALASLDALDERLERLVVERADAVCAVTQPIADDLQARYARPVATITNGFDPEEATGAGTAADSAAEGLLDGRRRSLVHTGTLAYGGRPLAPLLHGLTALAARAPEVASRLEVVLAGPVTDAERAEVRAAGLESTVRFTGPVSHATSLALQRSADCLLVLTGPGQTGVATGKLYEYLSAGRPILVIGDETAAARIVADAGAGLVVGRDDRAALAGALRRLVERPGDLPAATRDAAARFSYPVLAERMASLVEEAILGRTERRAGR